MNSGSSNQTNIVLFDGVCNLCSSAVQFIIKHDPNARYKFASLQSDLGQKFLDQFNLDSTELQTIILVNENSVLQRSDAALEIARHLSGGWPLFYIFKIVPKFFRDPVYNLISRNRYAWFGKKEVCWIPTAELKSRFIDS